MYIAQSENATEALKSNAFGMLKGESQSKIYMKNHQDTSLGSPISSSKSAAQAVRPSILQLKIRS